MRIYINNPEPILPVPLESLGREALFYEPSPVDAFISDEVYDSSDADSKPAIHIASDVSILFNQQRLSKELAPIVADWFSAHQVDLSDRYSSLSDDEILSCIKSKYLQRSCEIADWTKYLSDCLDELVEAKKVSEPKEPTDPSQGTLPGDSNIKS